ncbi:hypothetical protein SH661x_001941 [Planctomicrobium sp. SH661]|uniref:hypothetical protein n=1 Tax=Planctomicrobium sp. SH661 TaxID=3448124 RepID=UPI003F5B1470
MKHTRGGRWVPTTRQLNSWDRAADAASRLNGGDAPLPAARNPDLAMIRNQTGDPLPQYSVVQCTSPVIDPATDEDRYRSLMAFNGTAIGADDEQRIAITQLRLADGDVDPFGVVSGVTWARLTGPADKTSATTKEDQSTLEASDSGPCVILYDPGPDDEERIALVRIGGGSSSGSSGGGDSTGGCDCSISSEVGAIEFGDILLPANWSFDDPLGLEASILISHTGTDAEYDSDGYTLDCPEDEPPPEE